MNDPEMLLEVETAPTELASEEEFAGISQPDKIVTGFRLKYLELYNWGTFNGQVCRLNLESKNGLLTGDIGSGKSTVVDAITTLLVPAQKVAYNKAAGAELKERTLRTYVQGHYKSGRNESGTASKPVALRDSSSYSVILGVFENLSTLQAITLAQVFWIRDVQGQPQRFFVGVEESLSIAKDFSNFGSDPLKLKKLLRNKFSTCELFESFPPYGAWFRRRFGIETEQALDLFHQTASMKSVGNLTDFVRSHMLEQQDIRPQIEGLIGHFEDLNSAHESVLKAGRQVDALTPIVSDCEQLSLVETQRDRFIQDKDALRTFFNLKRSDLLQKRINFCNEELIAVNIKIEKVQEKVNKLRAERDDLKESINQNGGGRLSRLAAEITVKTLELSDRQTKADRYAALAQSLGFETAPGESIFANQVITVTKQKDTMKSLQATCQNNLMDQIVAVRQLNDQMATLQSEIDSLSKRKSNIPRNQIGIRDNLCQAVGLSEDDLPFAGELMQIKESEQAWEGAAERAMHSFALAMLVPDKHYAAVADYVDKTHLGGRLIYYRMRKQSQSYAERPASNTLAGKIAIKSDTQHYDWLENEIAHRFDYLCCSTQEEFRKYSKAITRAGQIKAKDERHDKDDRHKIDDRSRYVLGWSNAEKLRVLKQQTDKLEQEGKVLAQSIADLNHKKDQIGEQLDKLSKLEEYKSHREIDWKSTDDELQKLVEEKGQIESTSNLLAELNSRLSKLESDLGETENTLLNKTADRSKIAVKLENSTLDLQSIAEETSPEIVALHQASFAALELFCTEILGEITLTYEQCNGKESTVREKLQNKIDGLRERCGNLQKKIVVAMQKFKDDFPIETSEFDASIEAASEYKEMLNSLQINDLPRFRQRFKDLLNENTIREVANFQMYLHRERETIRERIENINQSLTQIDYNPDRYISLETQASQDADIRDFQRDLKACTEDAFSSTEDSQYSEEKFLQVKAIIERFKGREGQTDQDKRWTNRVTDVRNWYTFAASERWRENEEEHEHYSDSDGKSGGQKEKLAYTILAASLAYQFGLSWVDSRSKSFRFVVIDEAFGRGSDDSARYGLKLFEKLNLQLLVVTPLQKINIIEPFVASVGYVHNESGQSSRLRNMTIEAYQEERARRLV